MNKVSHIYMNNGKLRGSTRYRITETAPVFSWAVKASYENAHQTAYLLQIFCGDVCLWDSGWMETRQQEAAYAGDALPSDKKLTVRVTVRDNRGDIGESLEETFYVSNLPALLPAWIAPSQDEAGRAVYFRKEFDICGPVEQAVLYVCGLGYHQLFLNGKAIDTALLDPIFSDYSKTHYYVMLAELQEYLVPGRNCLCVALGEGWRRNEGVYMEYRQDPVDFFGLPQLSAALKIGYTDGREAVVSTDESWVWRHGAITYNNLFNGETYDAREAVLDWNMPVASTEGYMPVKPVESPGGQARVMTVEPIVAQEVYKPRSINYLDENTCVVDFGQNIAGVCRIRLPQGMSAGDTITINHQEMLDNDGSLYLPPLRGAACQDKYIAAGDGRDLTDWQPTFTYHGFRYVQIVGLPLLEEGDIEAVSIYTDVESTGVFSCGSALVNAIQKTILQTEKANLMGIFTDCPQRDERLAWMNDATVRFEETPYNFGVGRLFSKVIQDLLDVQGEDGSICCTAPFLYGQRPAEPVCSSFLVAGLQAWMHTGNTEIIRHAYEGFKGWERCLTAHSDGYLVNYTYNGDWAGPGYACHGDDEGAENRYTPGLFMSSGYYYFNAVTLVRFAELLGEEEDKKTYEALAANIRKAMLDTWFDPNTGKICTGSQGCQAFALWLGLIPEDKRPLAAQQLHEDLVRHDYRITTGNLCTRYLYDILTEYGFIEDAWKLISREKYPSIGHMLQHEATTVWERFEFKMNPHMNSHNHPMYGAVGYWFYAYLAGIKPAAPGFEEVSIKPYIPQDLLSVNATVHTVRGDITVRWFKRFGKTRLHVTVPFGMTAHIDFGGETRSVGSGFWHLEQIG